MIEFLCSLVSSIALVFLTAFSQAFFKQMFKEKQKNYPVLYVWLRTRNSSSKK